MSFRYKEEILNKTRCASELEEKVEALNEQIRMTDLRSKEKQDEMEHSLTEYEKIKEAFVLAKSENDDLRQERSAIDKNASFIFN